MKAITIKQPWAEMIACGEKRVENRTWNNHHRGALAIHAGRRTRETDRVCEEMGIDPDAIAYSAVVAVARLAGILTPAQIRDGAGDVRWPWLRSHRHIEGPYCWILDEVLRIEPVACAGHLGIWTMANEENDDERNR